MHIGYTVRFEEEGVKKEYAMPDDIHDIREILEEVQKSHPGVWVDSIRMLKCCTPEEAYAFFDR